MKIAVLSGKGGAGKTMVAVNLAAAAKRAVYIDCDVEEPNGRLFWKPAEVRRTQVGVAVPEFDPALCTGCRRCVDFCRFNALVYIRETPRVFPEVCHSCGGCALVCPNGAVREKSRPIGVLEQGRSGDVTVITGELSPGEASGVPLIREALRADTGSSLTVIDCPPGSACPVMESAEAADYCILVAEPTAFGLHNVKMVHELAVILGKPCGVIINKQEKAYEPLELFCRENGLEILARIGYDAEFARLIARGEILYHADRRAAALFDGVLKRAGGGRE